MEPDERRKSPPNGISLKTLNLHNFKSFLGNHTFNFPTVPGLYCLTGQNLVNPKLGANGCGKSTLLDAIYWCLYGRTTRGLKAGDIISWEQRTATVELTLSIGGKSYVIRRQQAPNSLTVNQKPVEQPAIDKLLRLGADSFTHAIMLPQFGETFFDLSPTDKLNLFSKVMALEYWLDKSKVADELATEIERQKQAAELKQAELRGQLTATAAELTALHTKHANAENESKGKRKAAATEAKALRTAQGDVLAVLASLEVKRHQAVAARGDRSNAKDNTQSTYAQALTNATVLERQLKTQQEALTKLTGLEATCPTCFQKVDAAHLKKERRWLEGQVTVTKKAYGEACELRQKLAVELRAADKACEAALGDIADIERNQRDFEREKHRVELKIQANKAAQEQLAAANPYTKLIAEKQAQEAALKKQAVKLKAEVSSLNEEHAAVSYWVGGFKKIRLFIIEETLRDLELEVNNNLANLGLLDWQIEFDVERENKTGGVTKGFVVLVHNSATDKPVRFEAWSGGETQRLRLAGDLGLANLIMDQAGLTSTIEFYDEPSKHMNPEGLTDLAETLHYRALETGKVIFLVDHHNIDFGSFKGTITVTKDENGSHVGE